jgi:hypothetical protein
MGEPYKGQGKFTRELKTLRIELRATGDQEKHTTFSIKDVSTLREDSRLSYRLELVAWINSVTQIVAEVNHQTDTWESEIQTLPGEDNEEPRLKAIKDHREELNKTHKDSTGNDLCSLQSLLNQSSTLLRHFKGKICQLDVLKEQDIKDRAQARGEELYQAQLHQLTEEPPEVASLSRNLTRTHLSQQRTQAIKLPTTDIPSFDGDVKSWTSFWDVFKYTIHENEQLPEAAKLTYLRSVLKGKAAIPIMNLELTNDGYQQAIRILKDRYSSSTAITQALYQELKAIKPASSNRYTDLNSVYERLEVVISQLRTQGEDIEALGPFIITTIREKLPYSTNIDLENQKASAHKAWTADELLKALREIYRGERISLIWN